MRLIDFFYESVRAAPDRMAFVGPQGTLTYRQTGEYAEKIAAGLYSIGALDANVAVLSPNHPVAFACMMGIFRAGCRWVPVNMRNPAQVNAALLASTDCQVLFYAASLAGHARELVATVPTVKRAICIDGPVDKDEFETLEHFIGGANAVCPQPADDPSRVETLFPTGGTTGLSKAALWTQTTWNAAIAAFWINLPCEVPAVHLVAAPMTHAAGVVALMMMARAATSVVIPHADAASILESIASHRITHLYLPPTVIYNMLAHPKIREFDYSSLRCIVVAGAPIAPEKLREAMSVFGPVMCESFGQAEAPMFLTFVSSRELVEAPGAERWASCGRPTLGLRVEIMNEKGELLPPHVRGEIVARGDLLFGGYYKNPKATEDALRFGWLHTGDVGYRDDQGFIYIVDRMKDMIITGGFNVFSAEVEHVILSHPAVEDCAVIGVPDPKWGEAVKAVIQCKSASIVRGEEIIALVKERLGAPHAPKTVDFVELLPRSPNGKVLKREIRDGYWNGSERAVG